MTPETLSCQITNELSEIAIVNWMVDELIARHQLSPRIASSLKLALEEILTNTISYGYEGGEDDCERRIRISAALADGMIIVNVEDDGRPFNPLEAMKQEPDLTASIVDRPIGGIGLFLAGKMVDESEYQYKEGKNLLVLKKRVPLEQGVCPPEQEVCPPEQEVCPPEQEV